jgi:hypothetical protein
VQLLQNNDARKTAVCLEAHITQGNLSNEAKSGGLSLPFKPMLVKDTIPKREGCEALETDPRLPSRRPATFKTYTLLPPGSDSICASPKYGPGVREQWVRWLPEVGTTFSLSSLAYLADAFRPLPEAYGVSGHWFPTLSYGMEVKRGPPPGTEGWEWLFLRIEIGECIAGRYDMVVLIADGEGNVVAVSRHTALIISAERNYQGRLSKI